MAVPHVGASDYLEHLLLCSLSWGGMVDIKARCYFNN